MKIIIIGDIHGKIESVKYVSILLSGIDFDYILLVGDIGLDYDINNKYEKMVGFYYFETILKLLSIFKKPILYVPGNHDHADIDKIIKFKGIKNVDYLTKGEIFKDNKINILGIGGSPSTPGKWTYEWADTNISVSDRYSYEYSLLNILLTHSPPYGSKIDSNLFNQKCGSKRIMNLIESYKFDILFCGHIHERCGIDKINGLLCLNAGNIEIKTNQPNVSISSFYMFDSSIDNFKLLRYLIAYDIESGYYEFKIQPIKI